MDASVKAHTEVKPVRLGVAQYLGYAGGDAANNLTFMLVSMFLLVYYTDVVDIAAGPPGGSFSWRACGARSPTSSRGAWSTGPTRGGASSGRTSSSPASR